jgi:serine/threonine protein kinase
LKYKGHGACGNIYSGTYSLTEAKVAVKHIKANDEKTRQHTLGEIEAHQTSTHPACLGYVASKEAGGNMLLATPFMPQGDMQRTQPGMEWNSVYALGNSQDDVRLGNRARDGIHSLARLRPQRLETSKCFLG